MASMDLFLAVLVIFKRKASRISAFDAFKGYKNEEPVGKELFLCVLWVPLLGIQGYTSIWMISRRHLTHTNCN